MNSLNIKGIFTFLFTITIFLTITLGNVFAVEMIYIPVNLAVKNSSGTILKNGADLGVVKAGDKITASAYCNHELALLWSQNPNFMSEKGYKYNDKGMALLSYMFDSTDKSNYKHSSDPTQLTITIPNFEAGSEHYLVINAVAACDGLPEGNKEYQATSGTFAIKFKMASKMTGEISAVHNNASTTLANGSTTIIAKGDKVTILGRPADNFSIISGSWQINNNAPTNISFTGASETLNIPGTEGQTIKLTLTGTLKDGGKTTTKTYIFKIPEDTAELTGSVSASSKGNTLSTSSVNELDIGESITLSGNPVDNFSKLIYKWDDDALQTVNGAIVNTVVPNYKAGSEHILTVGGTLKDGKIVNQKNYIIKIPDASVEPEEPEKLTGNVTVKLNSKSLVNNSTNVVEGGEILNIMGTPANNFASIIYRWDNGEENEILGATGNIEVLVEEGYTHTLKVYGVLTDGVKTTTKTYRFIIEEDDELIIEPWMREDFDAEGLLVSLRNDTEEEKANKNFYMIDEEVIYYVDYKNCGNDIKNEVKIILKLPLNFKIVNSASGVVSHSDDTITWTFKDGLEEGQAGTKIVILKYTKLSKSSYDYEIVYPQADIYKASKRADSSAVINYIYVSESNVIEEEHEPYMFGDEEKPTFRPDDTITRAEGALVLTRIFGIKTTGTQITTKYSDIKETYKEAQKAITAASDLGIINGYEDGTYRPNDKMTRAEFMKIIASYIEVLGDKKGINGLEVKENSTIKVYQYTFYKEHWAIDYVTLLVRLNMTSVSESKKDLRLNDEITRAEVAQLINFFSFRAPAEVSTGTKTNFIDVSRRHELYEDIVEATRDTHKYVITDEGKERKK